MRICAAVEIAAPIDAVWELVADQTRYVHFMAGMTRWEVVGNAEGGLGRRLTTLEQRCALYPARNLGWLPQQQAPQGGGDKLFVFPLGCNRKQSIRNWARVDPFIRY